MKKEKDLFIKQKEADAPVWRASASFVLLLQCKSNRRKVLRLVCPLHRKGACLRRGSSGSNGSRHTRTSSSVVRIIRSFGHLIIDVAGKEPEGNPVGGYGMPHSLPSASASFRIRMREGARARGINNNVKERIACRNRNPPSGATTGGFLFLRHR